MKKNTPRPKLAANGIYDINNVDKLRKAYIDLEQANKELEKKKELLKNTHSELHKYTKVLEISNQELEQFAYVASHDLQEPLRMITSFLHRLEKNYENILDDRAKKYIHFAVDGAHRMRQIILDLLEFSRVGRIEDKMEEIDLNELIRDVQLLYRKKIQEKKAVISTSELPVIIGPKAGLQLIFQNLISNALKYQKPGRIPKLYISCTEGKTHWKFTVKDNGIGIDPEYFDKIFLIFQRLHPQDEYSGTGIGLAITKKIIENIDGKIWVKSAEDKGCSFYFTIPNQIQTSKPQIVAKKKHSNNFSL